MSGTNVVSALVSYALAASYPEPMQYPTSLVSYAVPHLPSVLCTRFYTPYALAMRCMVLITPEPDRAFGAAWFGRVNFGAEQYQQRRAK
eukprot:3741483-Rhodomonas_salina.1